MAREDSCWLGQNRPLQDPRPGQTSSTAPSPPLWPVQTLPSAYPLVYASSSPAKAPFQVLPFSFATIRPAGDLYQILKNAERILPNIQGFFFIITTLASIFGTVTWNDGFPKHANMATTATRPALTMLFVRILVVRLLALHGSCRRSKRCQPTGGSWYLERRC